MQGRSYMFNPHVRRRTDGTVDQGQLTVSSQVFSSTFSPTERSSARYLKKDGFTGTLSSRPGFESNKWARQSAKTVLKPHKVNSLQWHGNSSAMRTPSRKARRNFREAPASSRRLGFPSEITQIGLRQK